MKEEGGREGGIEDEGGGKVRTERGYRCIHKKGVS